MDRDVLLLLLVGAVLANVGLLVLAALLRARPWETPVAREASARERESLSWAPVPMSRPEGAPPAASVAAVTVAPSPGLGLSGAAVRPVAQPPIALTPAVAATPAIAAPPFVAPGPTASAAPSVAPTPAVAAGPYVAAGTTAAPAPSLDAAAPAHRAARLEARSTARHPAHRAAPKRPKRPQRFRMPDRDEDHERTAHSIAAFLGEPIAPSAGSRPHRRRHRARRVAGATARTDLILVLDGEAPIGRVTRAVAAALRDAVRESDAIVELPGGRLRVTLDTDAAGGQAFLARARGVMRPWLDVLGASMDVAPEPAAADAATASAAG